MQRRPGEKGQFLRGFGKRRDVRPEPHDRLVQVRRACARDEPQDVIQGEKARLRRPGRRRSSG